MADPSERTDVLLWFAVLAGPLAFALAELASYSLAPTACWLGHPLVLYIVPLAPLLVVLAGAALAWRRRHREPPGSTETGDAGDSRSRFMALAGFWLCLGFALAIVAFTLPPLLLRVCD